ncbi:MAG: hypothetical protein EZS28_032625 [Streblomastix strix]|uniref:Uncharacterized protein n=1 Tax=Streblomastix strix TaxID=222440 RepID=A0A5J4UN35_9EUKA|nr:MAG: hypothetical protein EZS28_032625 [Streblomastix strix]
MQIKSIDDNLKAFHESANAFAQKKIGNVKHARTSNDAVFADRQAKTDGLYKERLAALQVRTNNESFLYSSQTNVNNQNYYDNIKILNEEKTLLEANIAEIKGTEEDNLELLNTKNKELLTLNNKIKDLQNSFNIEKLSIETRHKKANETINLQRKYLEDLYKSETDSLKAEQTYLDNLILLRDSFRFNPIDKSKEYYGMLNRLDKEIIELNYYELSLRRNLASVSIDSNFQNNQQRTNVAIFETNTKHQALAERVDLYKRFQLDKIYIEQKFRLEGLDQLISAKMISREMELSAITNQQKVENERFQMQLQKLIREKQTRINLEKQAQEVYAYQLNLQQKRTTFNYVRDLYNVANKTINDYISQLCSLRQKNGALYLNFCPLQEDDGSPRNQTNHKCLDARD